MTTPFVAIAGSTGAMGQLMAAALHKRSPNIGIKALVRPGTSADRVQPLRAVGATIAEVDLTDIPSLTRELTGAICVISTLQGLEDIILVAQGNLLDAAVAARVPRFIPTDYSLDFTKTRPGSNRNLDLRLQFHARLDASGIAWTSVLNGGFTELLATMLPLIDRPKRTVRYVSNADQQLDFTTMPDVAAYTAAVAVDPQPTPKFLRIAGDVVTARDLARIAARTDVGADGKPKSKASEEVKPYTLSMMAPLWLFEWMISAMKWWNPGQGGTMTPWQGMQYLANQFSGEGKLEPLDNGRYKDLHWTSIEEYLRDYQMKEATKEATKK